MQQRSTSWIAPGTAVRPKRGAVSRYEFPTFALSVRRSVDGLVRIRVARYEAPADESSYAIENLPEWAPERSVEGVRYDAKRGVVTIETLGGAEPFNVEVRWNAHGFQFAVELAEQHHVYGLGEKTGHLDKRGRTYVMWNTDEPIHEPLTDPLYQSIPFALRFEPRSTLGLFLDCTATSYFDVGESRPDRLIIEGYDRSVDLYLFDGNDLASVVRRYTELTGRMPLPPEWALGFQQCRYSYHPAQRVLEVAERLRAEAIPCDVIYLDIHYMNGYRVFSWDPERFSDPAALTARLREMGFRVVTIVDPGVKVDADYEMFRSGMQENAFIRYADGRLYVGRVWPGESAYPDFTRSEVRSWWARAHRELFDRGVAGIWNDMNEPSDFDGDPLLRYTCTPPDDLVVGNEGRSSTLGKFHNVYGNGMNMATREAYTEQRPDERGFILTRAGYAGIQRYAAVWTGDNHSWWEHLAGSIPMLINLGLSGVAFAGSDAGGFQQNASGDLFARWMGAAAFTPFFRAHSDIETADHEPWSFGAGVLEHSRRAVQTRYRLLPYLYTLFEHAARSGEPVMRPLVYHFPDDERVHTLNDQFVVGEAILVAPVVQAGVDYRAVYLPRGTWYDLWTGRCVKEATEQGAVVVVESPLGHVPAFVRGGAIIPTELPRAHTGEAGDGVLRLLIAPDGSGQARGELYADAGEGFAYRQGVYTRLRFTWGAHGTGDAPEALRVEAAHRGCVTRWRSIHAINITHSGWDAPSQAVCDFPNAE